MIELPKADYTGWIDPGFVDYYTAETVRKLIAQARSDALEEAASLVEDYEDLQGLAAELRALKEKQT